MLRAMEAEILDGPVPVIDPAEEARLTNADTKLAEAMRQLRCRGECTQAAPAQIARRAAPISRSYYTVNAMAARRIPAK